MDEAVPLTRIVARVGFFVAALAAVTLLAACSPIAITSGTGETQTARAVNPSPAATCFYSDRFGTEPIADGRVYRWCGPKPKALF
jgi:hypothetical protein